MGRRTVLGVVTVVAVAAALLGWVAGQRIQSPAQIAADTAPPEPSLITVPIESAELSVDVIVRGQLEFSDTESLAVQPTTIDGTTIITRTLVEVGDELNEGDVMIEVAGRPVFVLEGELPEYRSLIPAADGPDVLQLEEALARLGLDPGAVDGDYTVATEEAIEALYLRAGYTANLPGPEEINELELLRDSVTDAQRNLSDLQSSDSGSDGPGRSSIIRAEESLRLARIELQRAKDEQTSANAAATQAVNAANAALTAAEEALTTAKMRLREAREGTHPDTGQPPTAAELQDLIEVRDTARVTRDDAIATRDQAAVESREIARIQAEIVRAASIEVQIAEADLTDLRTPVSSGDDSTELISRAREQVADAQKSLADAEARIGTAFPAAEFRFLPTLPRTVQRTFVKRGDSPTDAVMEVSGSGVSVTSSVSKADRSLLEVGNNAVFAIDDLGIAVPLEISFLAEEPGGGDVGGDRYLMRMVPTEETVPEEAYGQNARVTIPVGETSGEVLAVPLAALSAGADGTSRLEVETSPGETSFVKVSTGLKALGLIEITPLDGAELSAGDRVVVGRDNQGASSDESSSESNDEDG